MDVSAAKIMELTQRVRDLTDLLEQERHLSRTLQTKLTRPSPPVASDSSVSFHSEASSRSESRTDCTISERLDSTKRRLFLSQTQLAALRSRLKLAESVLERETGHKVDWATLERSVKEEASAVTWQTRTEKINQLEGQVNVLSRKLSHAQRQLALKTCERNNNNSETQQNGDRCLAAHKKQIVLSEDDHSQLQKEIESLRKINKKVNYEKNKLIMKNSELSQWNDSLKSKLDLIEEKRAKEQAILNQVHCELENLGGQMRVQSSIELKSGGKTINNNSSNSSSDCTKQTVSLLKAQLADKETRLVKMQKLLSKSSNPVNTNSL